MYTKINFMYKAWIRNSQYYSCSHTVGWIEFWSSAWTLNCFFYAGFSCDYTKEYILVIEGTATAIILQRCVSPNLSTLCLQYSPTTWLSDITGGRGWVSHIFLRPWPVLSLLSLIYILWTTLSQTLNFSPTVKSDPSDKLGVTISWHCSFFLCK